MKNRIRYKYLTSIVLGVCLAGWSINQADAQTVEQPLLTFSEPLGNGPVFIVPVKNTIDNELARYIDRAIGEAEANDAALVLLDIDTFGGLVDAADKIRKTVLNASMPTIAFIDKNAASAGALISYAADRIVMVPGASIGAATVVEGVGGEAAPDKYQSYMRGLMRSTAEANGKDPRIAEAMVDETIEVEGISEAGKVLTLSSEEAVRFGVAEAILTDMNSVLAQLNVQQAEIVRHRATWIEVLLRFLGSPIVQSILMLMMMGGLYFELQTPGVGFPGLMAGIGAALFFAPHYMMGLVESWELILFGMGVFLLLVEIFFLPGFGVAGIAGLILVMGSLFTGLIGNVGLHFPSGGAVQSAIGTMAITLILLVVLGYSLGRYLPRSERFKTLVLAPELNSAYGYTSSESEERLMGQTGTTLSPLRPSGAADIDGRRVDVVTAGEFIPSGTAIRVVGVRGSRVEVRQVEALSSMDETSLS